MAPYFESAEAFWQMFILIFVLQGGVISAVVYGFLQSFLRLPKSGRKARCVVFVLLLYAVSAFCLQAQVLGLAQRGLYLAVCLAFSYIAVRQSGRNEAYRPILASMLVVTVLALTEGISAPFLYLMIDFGAMRSTAGYAMGQAALAALTVVLPAVAFWLVCRCFRAVSPSDGRYIFILLAPIALLILIVQLLLDFGYSMTRVTESGVDSVFNSWYIMAVFALAIVCFFIIIWSFRALVERVSRQRESAVLERQLEAQRFYATEMARRYALTRSFRHDLHNHLIVLRGLIDGGQDTAAAEYLYNIEETAERLSYSGNTGNAALDVLLADKLAFARQSGITVRVDAQIPKNAEIEDFYLCAIVSNALDNAVTACETISAGEKYIDIKIGRNKDFLLIDIINSCAPTPRQQRPGGLGLQNARLACEKYGGSLNAERSGDKFIFTALLCVFGGE